MHAKFHEALTVSTAVDGSPILPPPDPLSCHPPLGRLDAAGAAQLSGRGRWGERIIRLYHQLSYSF